MTASGWPSLTADETNAYLAFNNHVYAININTGNEIWRFPSKPDSKITFYATPALTEDGQLIIGGYNSVLYSINKETGTQNWAFEGSTGRFIGGALTTKNGIFAPSSDNFLYALSNNGDEIWQPFETDDPIWSTPVADANCDCIYVPSMDHYVYVIDAHTGNLVWKTDDLGGAIVGKPAISEDNILYIGTFNKEMYAIDTIKQQVKWTFETKDWIWSGPTIKNDQIYFGDLSGALYALNKDTGEEIWHIQFDDSIVGEPLVLEDQIVLTTVDGKLTSLTMEGGPFWSKQIEGNLYAGPIYANGTILVANNKSDALLLAFDENGNQKWVFQPEEKK